MSEPNLAENDSPLEEPAAGAPEPQDADDFAGLFEQLRLAEERALRAQAELENYRKRARRELEDERKYANMPLVSSLLPVLDNLERAIGAAEQNEGAAGLLEGVKMVADQLKGVLQQNGCQRIKDLGETFDPNQHEAIGQEASSDFATGSVSRVTQFGYQLHDRVVRPSLVMISTGPADSQEEPPATETDD